VNSVRRRRQLDSGEVEEIIQEVYVKLCAHSCRALSEFEPGGEGAEFAYLKVIADRVVADWFRKRSAAARDQCHEVSLESAGEVGDFQSSSADRKVLIAQVFQALAEIADERDRLIFWLYYRAGLTAQHIARFASLELGQKGVESAILKLTRLVREKLKTSEKTTGKAQGGTFS
jgi:RNA polymerase sigma factor (sigma-70 family)